MRNNIMGRVGGDSYELPVETVKNWRQDHNTYLNRPRFAKTATDVIGDPSFLSTDPASRDYWRIPADGPLARAGAGGELPNYIGAFPPSPAPKDGDWFTRMRDRWPVSGRIADPALGGADRRPPF